MPQAMLCKLGDLISVMISAIFINLFITISFKHPSKPCRARAHSIAYSASIVAGCPANPSYVPYKAIFDA